MRTKQLFSTLACSAILGGCATPAAPPKPAPPTMAALMNSAEAALKAGKNEDGIALLKSAVAAFPNDNGARLRVAQVQFDGHNYGDAILHAQQVIDRDPDDLVAHSILAVSGLRVSSKALTDLALKNNLTGSVRAEAQDLAKLLRANIGGDIMPTTKTPHPKPPKPVAVNLPALPKPAGGSPADWLNNLSPARPDPR